MTGTSTVTISRFFDRPEEQVGIDRLLFRENLLDHGEVVARWQACGVRRERGEHLAAFAVRHQHDAAFAILVEEALGDAAKSLEIPIAQRVCQRQHLERAGDPLHLRVEYEANAAYGFEHPLGRVLAVLLVIVVDEAGRENDQRQRGSRDQEGETHWQ